MCEEFGREVGIEVDGRLVDTHYDDSIANLSLNRMVSLVSPRPALCFVNKYNWARGIVVGDHDDKSNKMARLIAEKLRVRKERGLRNVQRQSTLYNRQSATF